MVDGDKTRKVQFPVSLFWSEHRTLKTEHFPLPFRSEHRTLKTEHFPIFLTIVVRKMGKKSEQFPATIRHMPGLFQEPGSEDNQRVLALPGGVIVINIPLVHQQNGRGIADTIYDTGLLNGNVNGRIGQNGNVVICAIPVHIQAGYRCRPTPGTGPNNCIFFKMIIRTVLRVSRVRTGVAEYNPAQNSRALCKCYSSIRRGVNYRDVSVLDNCLTAGPGKSIVEIRQALLYPG